MLWLALVVVNGLGLLASKALLSTLEVVVLALAALPPSVGELELVSLLSLRLLASFLYEGSFELLSLRGSEGDELLELASGLLLGGSEGQETGLGVLDDLILLIVVHGSIVTGLGV